MTLRTYTVEIRFDCNDEQHEVFLDSVKMGAKHMLTTATLIAGERPPVIKLEVGDLFMSNKDINLAEDIV